MRHALLENDDFSENESGFLGELQDSLGQFAARNPMDESGQAARENIFNALARLGKTPFLGLTMGERCEPGSLPLLMAAMETVASVSPSLCLCTEYSTRMLGRALDRWADDSQKQRFLDPLLEGRHLGALAICEQNPDSEDDILTVTGNRQGETVVINGCKEYVVNGPVAAVIGVSGCLDGRPALFMIEEDTPGLWVKDSGETFGYPGATFATVRMEKCYVPEHNVIICEGGFKETLRCWENQVLIGASLGLTRSALKTILDYARMKKYGLEPISADQGIAFKLAEISYLYQSARNMGMKAARAAEKDPDQAPGLMMCAKVFCTEVAEKVSSEGLNILGARGCFGFNPVQLAYRCAKYGRLFGSTREFSKVKPGEATWNLGFGGNDDR